MEASKLKFLEEAGKLKRTARRGWVIKNIDEPETISGHMYRMSLMPLLVMENLVNLDTNKIIKLCLIHDLAECIVGDITPHDNVSKTEKHKRETDAINHLASLLPNIRAAELKDLFDEYENQETPESQLTKDFDLYDMVHQAFEYEKLQFDKTGVIPDLSEFFCQTKVLSRIRNKEVNDLVNEIIKQRVIFWKLNSEPSENSESVKNSSQSSENDSGIQLEEEQVQVEN